ncbi:MAG: HEAT repeat domain-containing protein, partial [Planctomycetes bacterium]|nr:HEAT repeat domain-containing protein [Planctomycetota bacterium]
APAMARRTVEAQLAELVALGRTPDSHDLPARLTAALASPSHLVAAKAADLVGRLGRHAEARDVIAMFERFLAAPAAADKGCIAKTAAAKALFELGEFAAEAVFLKGARHVQPERSFGPPSDSAGELRGTCGLGLVRIGHREAVLVLADLLADPVPQTRAFAARGLAYSNRDDAALLLRFKLHVRDAEIDVLAECMNAMARIQPAEAVPLLARFLEEDDPDVRAAAALALSETRAAAALEALRRHLIAERVPETRSAVLVAAAGLRLPAGIDWLIELIAAPDVATAAAAVEALAVYRGDAPVAARVRAAAADCKERPVRAAVERHFGSSP